MKQCSIRENALSDALISLISTDNVSNLAQIMLTQTTLNNASATITTCSIRNQKYVKSLCNAVNLKILVNSAAVSTMQKGIQWQLQ